MKVGLGRLALLLEKIAAGHKWVLLVVLAVAIAGGALQPVSADPPYAPNLVALTVTKLDDTNDGACAADCSLREAIAAAASGDTVTFASGVTGAITLSLGQLVINKNLTIQGPGAGQLSISGGNASQGGAINNTGSLTITNITFSGNSASNNGGAIWNNGSLTITNSTFSGNSVTSPYGGGGAIYNSGGSLTITNSTFSGNSANYFGGAISNDGSLTITNSTFSGNSVTDLYGGAIYNAGGSLTINNITFSGNSATYGGAIMNNGGTLSLGNTIIAGNTGRGAGPDIYGPITTSRGHNLVGNSHATSGLTNGVNGDLVGSDGSPINPLLGPLALNGGATATHALLPGSPAIDAGNPAGCTDASGAPIATDQRGVIRPQGARCDIGAFEAEAAPAPSADLSLNKIDSPDPVVVGQNLTYTITVTNNGPSTATGVTLTDTLPTGVTYVSTTASPGSCSGTSTVNCALGSIPSGGSATVTIVVTPTTAGTINNTASVNATEADPNTANNQATASTTVNPPNVTLTVTKLADTNDGVCNADCSLREAIAAAVSGDTVTFAPGLTGAITLTSGQLVINKNLIIQGPGADQLSIRGGNASQGGAIYNTGSLTINDITFSGNSSSSIGGAIYNTGSLTINDITFSGNSISTTYGGAIYNVGSLTITNSTFTGNSASNGGAIFNSGGSLTITNSTFSGNSAAYSGGAVFNSGSLTVTNSTFSGNSALEFGGAIANEVGSSLTITNSSFSGNSATFGAGAIGNNGSLTINNSTFSGNSATLGAGFGGGAIYNNGTVSLGNTIIAGNTANKGPDIFGSVNSRGHNLVGNGAGASGLTNGVNGDLVGINPLLDPLALNGGATATHALLPGSPAIDAGNPAGCTDASGAPIATDQRGVIRPQGARCDIGAFEAAPAPSADLSLNKIDSPGPVVVGQNLTYTITVTNNGPSTATGVTLTDTLPTGVTYVSTTASPGSCSGTSTVTCTIGSLAINANATATIVVSPTIAGTITNTASVSAIEADPNTANNQATASTTVNPPNVTLTVTTLADTNDGVCAADCSLREAIIAANALASDDTITFSVSGTITLGSTLPTIASGQGTLTINGGGNIAISGNNAVRVLTNSGVLTLQNLTVKEGQSGQNQSFNAGGAGIFNGGTLTVTNSTFSGNSAVGGSPGGGILNNTGGILTITNSTFSGNSANYCCGGGGGGGIYNGGTLTISNSTFSGNSASAGGGIFNSHTMTVTNSTFSGNHAGGTGGGGGQGGGIYNGGGTLTVTNSTFSGNSTFGNGFGTAINRSGGAVTLSNTIVSGSVANCHGTIVNGGNNIDDGTTCGWSSTSGSMSSTDPILGALTGSPAYFPLNSGSPAIDAGNPAGCTDASGAPIATDQRGVTRPQGVRCDIGAYEAAPAPSLSITSPVTGATVAGPNVEVSFNVQNWTVGGKGQTHIHFHLDGSTDHLMFYYGADQVVELNEVSGPTAIATFVNSTTIRLNSLSPGLHTVRAHLATVAHLPPGNSEADVTVSFTVPPVFKVIRLPSGLRAHKAGEPDSNLSVNGESEDTVTIVSTLKGDKRVPVVHLVLRFSQGANIDFGDDLAVDADEIEGKAVFHRANPFPPVIQLRELRVRKLPQHDQVRVCPGAANLAQVNRTCGGGYVLNQGHPNLTTITFPDGRVFWRISGITGTGAMGQTNTAPTASSLAISPASPTDADSMLASYTYSDADGDLQSGTEIRWFNNGVPQAAFNDQATVPASATTAGEQWHFTVRPSDGIDFGALQTSTSVTIQTGDITPPNTTITSGPPQTTTLVTATFTFQATEGASTFQCRLDSEVFEFCVSPKSYSGVTTGSHGFQVKATDLAGNIDPTPATFSWTVGTGGVGGVVPPSSSSSSGGRGGGFSLPDPRTWVMVLSGLALLALYGGLSRWMRRERML